MTVFLCYLQLMSVKKASFECFVETCKVKFWSARDRREHCIGIHSFPHDFKFDPNQQKPQKQKNKKAGSASPEVVKKRGQNRQKKNSGKPRPASVFVAPMETDDQDSGTINTVSVNARPVAMATTAPNTISPPKSRSKLPVLNRRLSLNAKDVGATSSSSSAVTVR